MSTLKRESEMKLTSILITLLFTFTLAACGGGGGSSPDVMPEEPTGPTAEEMAAATAAVTAATEAATAANNAAATAQTAVDAAMHANPMAAQDAATAATEAAMAATTAAAAVMAGNMATVDAAHAAAMTANTAAEAATTAASALDVAEASAAEEARLAAEEAKKANTAKSEGIAKALVADDTPAADDLVEVAITRTTGGDTKVTLTGGTNDGTFTAVESQEYEKSDSYPPSISGWVGQSHMRTDDDASGQMVGIYTNMNPAKARKLVYDNDTDTTPEDTGHLGPFPSVGNLNELILDGVGEGALPADGLPDAATAAYTYDPDETVTGMINGTRGTFTCNAGAGSTCTLNVLGNTAPSGVNKNKLSGDVTGDWEFESADYVERIATQDTDYMYFGYWIDAPTDMTGDTEFTFDVIYGGSQAFATPSAQLVGTASYSGSAAGKYVTREGSFTGTSFDSESATYGVFTADANLTVNFAGSGLPADSHNKVTGSISNIMDGDQNLDFEINLTGDITNNEASPAETGIGSAEVAARYGTTLATSGDWAASFFGPAPADDATAPEPTPTGIAGEFNAHFPNAAIAGGFGAERTGVTNKPAP